MIRGSIILGETGSISNYHHHHHKNPQNIIRENQTQTMATGNHFCCQAQTGVYYSLPLFAGCALGKEHKRWLMGWKAQAGGWWLEVWVWPLTILAQPPWGHQGAGSLL